MIQGVVEKIKEVYFAGQDSSMDFFTKNWEKSKEAKAGLVELLGGEEFVINVNFDEEAIANTFPSCFSKIKSLLRYVDTEYETLTNADIINNIFNGRKLSRYIIKNKAMISNVQYIIERDSVNIELNLYTRNLELFFKTLYEKIAALKGEKIILSANHIDILSAGNVSGENSCYAQSIFRDKVTHHGAYSLAPHVFAQDGQTMIAYVLKDNGKKFSKRVWVHVNDARDKFVIGRKYGNWSDVSMKALYRAIEGLLGEPDANGWYLRSDVGSYFENDRVGFRYTEQDKFDEMGRPFYCGDNAAYYFYKRGTSSLFTMNAPAMTDCISCGCDHNYPEGSGMCYDCAVKFRRSRRCNFCDSEHDLQVFNGVKYCPSCVHMVVGLEKTCFKCKGTFTESGAMYGGDVWCSPCLDAYLEEERRERRHREEARARRDAEEHAYREAAYREMMARSGQVVGRVNPQWREITEEMMRAAGLLDEVQVGQGIPSPVRGVGSYHDAMYERGEYIPDGIRSISRVEEPIDPVVRTARRRTRPTDITGMWMDEAVRLARPFPAYRVDTQEEPTW